MQKAALWRPRQASAIAAIAVVALVFDLHANIFSRSVADPGNAAYAALRNAPAGRVTDLPVFLPDVHYGNARHFVDADAGTGISQWTLTGTAPDGTRKHLHGCDFYAFRDGLVTAKDSYWKIVD